MRTLYRVMPLGILLWVLLAAQSPSRAQESAVPHVSQPAPTYFDPGVLEFVKVFGLGGMIFTIWLFDYRRQRSLESIIEKYDGTQQAHLAAFKDINDRNMGTFREAMSAMQKVSEDGQSTAILCAQVNTKVAERLDYLTKERTG
jgi:hypothetical protein